MQELSFPCKRRIGENAVEHHELIRALGELLLEAVWSEALLHRLNYSRPWPLSNFDTTSRLVAPPLSNSYIQCMKQRRLISYSTVCSIKLCWLSARLYVVGKIWRMNVRGCLQSILLKRVVFAAIINGKIN